MATCMMPYLLHTTAGTVPPPGPQRPIGPCLLAVLCAAAAITAGCAHNPASVTDDVHDVATPAAEISDRVDSSRKAVGQVREHIRTLPSPDPAASQPPDIPDPIAAGLDQIDTDLAEIEDLSARIQDQQHTITAQAEALAQVRLQRDQYKRQLKKIRGEKQAEQRVWERRVLFGLIVAGLVLAGIGAPLVGWLMRSITTGLLIGVTGISLSATAKLWQQYWWVPTLAVGAVFLGVLGYAVYRAWLMRETFVRRMMGAPQGRRGKQAEAEVHHDAERRAAQQTKTNGGTQRENAAA